MEQILIYIYVGAVLIGLAFIFFVGVPAIIEALEKAANRKRFISSLKNAYEISPPVWNHVLIIAKKNFLDQEQMKLALERMLHDVITERSEYSKEKSDYIDSLLKRIIKEEPFEGIPDNLRIHLEHIHTIAEKEHFDIQPLANELRELTTKREKERKFGKLISMLSLLVGVVGAIYGGFSYHENTQTETVHSQPASDGITSNM